MPSPLPLPKDCDLKRLYLFVNALLITGGILIAAAAIIGSTPVVETKLYPVVSNLAAYDWKKDSEGRWSAEIHMVKNRTCRPTPEWGKNTPDVQDTKTATVLNPRIPPPYEVPIFYVDDDTPGSSHPALKGRQSFGRWSFGSRRRPVEAGSQLIFEPRHDCHSLFETVSEVGPITVGKDGP